MTPSTELVELLAAVDAIFLPIRDWSTGGPPSAIWAAQKAYRKEGIPHTIGGTAA